MSAGEESDAIVDQAADLVVDVLAPVAVDTAYSYRVPRGVRLAAGDFVEIPLGNRETTGVVWSVRNAPGGNLKSVMGKLDLPPLRKPLRDFVDWVANYTLARAAWCCGWRCAWANSSVPRASGSACASRVRRRSA